MIKNFEQFVLECYNKPTKKHINEAFQSSKLRELIKQHGKPKYSWENKMLYDLKDNEIIDVLDSREEYWKKYLDEKGESGQATFKLELKDGTVLVISNLGILKNYWGDIDKQKDEVFKKRHSERHVGNLGNSGDEIHRKHIENVNKIENRRFAERMEPYTEEIGDFITSAIYSYAQDFDVYNFPKNGEDYIEKEATFGNEECMVCININIECDEGREEYGTEYFDASFSLKDFEIYNEDGARITDDDIDYKDLYKPYNKKIEGAILDPYYHYGVRPEDFI